MLRSHKMLVFAGLLLFCLTFTSGVEARQKGASNQGAPLSAQDKQHILQDNFVLVKTVQAVPQGVQHNLIGKDIGDGMADAGQPFERTDYVIGKPLPFQRLIFAGTSAGYCLVYNECGGFGYRTEVSLYHLVLGKATLVWRADLQNSSIVFDLPQLRNEIVAGRFYSEQLPAAKVSH